jgi:hypothetical protein
MSIISAGNTTTTAIVVTGDTTGNLVFTTGGANTTALTLSNTQAATFSNAATATAFIPSGSTVPTNGIYLPSANAVAISTASTARLQVNSSGIMTNAYQPAFFATGSGGSITVAPGSNFPFNTLLTTFAGSNRNSGYNTGTYAYTAPVAGLYMFYMQGYISSNQSIAWYKNGSQLSYQDAALVTFASFAVVPTVIYNGSVTVELSANDYISMQPRTGFGNVSIYMGHSSFFGYLIG